jgi:acyl-CoA synthetase (NDP forming)
VDAMIALVLPTGATGDLVAAIQEAAIERRQSSITLTAVILNQTETVRLLDAKNGKVPAYGYPEAAAGALARAARYGEWRSAPHTPVPGFGDVDAAEARAVIRGFLAHAPGGGWLPPADVTALLRLYGIPLVSETEASTITGGTEVIIAVQDDQMFGPLVVFGLGGVATEVLADHAARLAPLTETDADTLINSIRSAPLLHGHRTSRGGAGGSSPPEQQSSPAADIPALRDVLMRVSRLADDLPEVTELDLNPVIARQLGAVAVDARIRVTPQVPQDPFLRRLRLTCRPWSCPHEVG